MKFFVDKLKENINFNTEINIICNSFSLNGFGKILDQILIAKKIRLIISTNKTFKDNQCIDLNEIFFENDIDNCEFEFSKYLYSKKWSNLINDKKFIIKICNDNTVYNSSYLILKNKDKNISYANFGNIFEKNLNNKNLFDVNKNQDNEAVAHFSSKFNDLWSSHSSYDISNMFNEWLLTIQKPLSCFDCYNKTLSYIFDNTYKNIKDIEINESNEFKNSLIYNSLYDFQKNAVYGLIDKLEKFNGCILADSVGLGKTYEALGVIKYYELKRQKVLVLTPKKLKENWTIFTQNSKLNPFSNEKFNYDVKNHSDINRNKGYSGDDNLSSFNWSDFDLLVIDESHNFRNYSWVNDEFKSKSRYQHLMEKVIKSGRNTKVLLLSATPVNNRMHDLNNQIKFITNDNDSALKEYGIDSIKSVCRYAEEQSNKWSKLPLKQRDSKHFSEMIGSKFKNLLNLISIARSRRQILSSYSETNLTFPKRLPPKNIIWNIDDENKINIKLINEQLNDLTLASYKILSYVYEEFLCIYDQLDYKFEGKKMLHINREKGLVSLMKINLFKRLESSIFSFNETIKKIIEKTSSILNLLFKENISLNFSNDELIDDNEYSETIYENNLKIDINHIDLPKFKSDLVYDLNLLENIYKVTSLINENKDSKLNTLIELIEEKINNPFNEGNKKIIIFTTFEDTALYIYNHLKNKYLTSVVTGTKNISNHPKLLNNNSLGVNDILTYFSPKSKKIEDTGLDSSIEFDILIGTDCISEGQNLQDCDCLINYDIHWNPVRIIQRFGRIDRLQSKNKYIQLINMWPNIELEEYIKLESRVRNKMEKVVHASTGDDHILKSNDNLSEEENYRLEQLNQLKENIDKYEESKSDYSFSSLTFNEYLIDLWRYNNLFANEMKNKYLFSRGFYSVVSSINDEDKNLAIFLFKKTVSKDKDNMIEPYVFVSVKVIDNEIILPNKTLNEILQIYKSYASKNNYFDDKALKQFVEITNDFEDMNFLKNIYLKSIDFLKSKHIENDFKKLLSMNANISETLYDFQLISFLIIL
ncbi:DEAD/DEAH box helicase [Malacoplasma iowae]|uniref:DEAD/DEAH box helicase n=1 Tax=Malacoplasma iowae TaxID=2116 RepID=UPI00022C648C|nr:DEAD/DEAH box helicase [Malacoplasma iowae]EGZ31717.1 helicase domain protein [Malacoplasma iowae 695]